MNNDNSSPPLPQQGGEQTNPNGCKICPFCGGTGAHAEKIHDSIWWGVHCPNGLCPTAHCFVIKEETEAEAIAQWNNRAAVLPQVGEAKPFTYFKEPHEGCPEYSKTNEFSDGEGGGIPLYTAPVGAQEVMQYAADKLSVAYEAGLKAAPASLGEAKAVVPEGWKLVPIKPTEAMHAAAVRTIVRCHGNDDFPPRVYAAMLDEVLNPPVALSDAAPVTEALPVGVEKVMNTEQQYAIKEAHRIAIGQDYFNARQPLMTPTHIRVFDDGFDRGYGAAIAGQQGAKS